MNYHRPMILSIDTPEEKLETLEKRIKNLSEELDNKTSAIGKLTHDINYLQAEFEEFRIDLDALLKEKLNALFRDVNVLKNQNKEVSEILFKLRGFWTVFQTLVSKKEHL